MKRRTLLASSAALASALAGCGIIGGTGTPRPTPTEASLDTTTAGDGTTDDGTTDDGSTPTDTPEPFIDYEIELTNIEKCGTSCRTATFTIKNFGTKAAPSTKINTKVFTGGDKIYDNDFDMGDIGPKSQRPDVKRDIDVGLTGANKIRNNDGDIVIEMTPRSGDYTGETFSFERTLDT